MTQQTFVRALWAKYYEGINGVFFEHHRALMELLKPTEINGGLTDRLGFLSERIPFNPRTRTEHAIVESWGEFSFSARSFINSVPGLSKIFTDEDYLTLEKANKDLLVVGMNADEKIVPADILIEAIRREVFYIVGE